LQRSLDIVSRCGEQKRSAGRMPLARPQGTIFGYFDRLTDDNYRSVGFTSLFLSFIILFLETFIR
jgi:hypothetical protein